MPSLRSGGVAGAGDSPFPLPTKEGWSMRRTALLVSALTVALALTMTAGPLSKQGLSPQPAQARLPALKVNRKLGGGNSVTFESGSGANQNKLTGSFIYNNDVGSKEGARIVTGSGARFVDRCG